MDQLGRVIADHRNLSPYPSRARSFSVAECAPVLASAVDPLAPSAQEECCSSPAELERFRQAVLADLNLQQRLRATRDRESFIRLTLAVGHEGGYRFTETDVEEAMRVSRRAWFERWID